MKRRVYRWVWPLIIGGITLCIWAQSLLPASRSSEQSDLVQGWLSRWLAEVPLGAFLLEHIRKVAHFVEFAVLGTAWAGYGMIYSRRPAMWVLLPGAATAAVDECLQFFGDGRSPQVSDWLLDMAGYVTGWLLVWAVATLWRRWRSRK